MISLEMTKNGGQKSDVVSVGGNSSKVSPCSSCDCDVAVAPSATGMYTASHHFGPDISARDISARTFHHQDTSACACFGPAVLPAHGHFISMDVSIQGLFGMRTFWLKEFLPPWISRHWIFWHLCYCAVMSLCQNIHCRKILVPKSPCVKKSLYRNVHGDKMSMCRNTYRAETCMCGNVPVMKYLCRNVSGQNVSCQNGGKPVYYYSLLITSKVQSVPKLCCIHSTGILFS